MSMLMKEMNSYDDDPFNERIRYKSMKGDRVDEMVQEFVENNDIKVPL